HGQYRAGSRDVATIEWISRDAESSRFGLIQDSLVSGRSAAIGGTLQGQLLEVRNSVIISPGDGLQLTPVSNDRASVVHVADSTVSAGVAFFRIEPATTDSTAGKMRVFVERTVYAPAAAESQEAVV